MGCPAGLAAPLRSLARGSALVAIVAIGACTTKSPESVAEETDARPCPACPALCTDVCGIDDEICPSWAPLVCACTGDRTQILADAKNNPVGCVSTQFNPPATGAYCCPAP